MKIVVLVFGRDRGEDYGFFNNFADISRIINIESFSSRKLIST